MFNVANYEVKIKSYENAGFLLRYLSEEKHRNKAEFC